MQKICLKNKIGFPYSSLGTKRSMNLKKTFSFKNFAVLREGCELYIMRIMFVKYKDGFHIPFHCSSYSNLRIILAVGILVYYYVCIFIAKAIQNVNDVT